jgi:apolipoprotein N-acyltransferase
MARYSGWLWARAVLVFTALLHTVAFPPFDVPEAAWVFATPALLWIIIRQPSRREFLLIVGGAMFVSWLVLLEWLRHVTIGGMIALSAIMAVFPTLWFAAAHWALPRASGSDMRRRILATLGLAGLWVVLEWVRGWFLTGFPWLPLAASQWQRPVLLQGAAFGGAAAVSFPLILFSLGLAAYLKRIQLWIRERKGRFCPEFYLAMAALFIVTFGMFGEIARQQRRPLIKAGMVQPNIPQSQKWDAMHASEILRVLEMFTKVAARQTPDAIFWPEAVMPAPVVGDAQMQAWVENLTNTVGVPLVFGAVSVEEVPPADGTGEPDLLWRNGVYVTLPRDGLSRFSYTKRHLVPFGEYVPLRRFFPNVAKYVPIGGDFVPGDSAGSLLVPVASINDVIRVTPLICYEDVFGNLARESVKSGTDLFFVATNDAWYGERGAAFQHAAHSALRAVETRRPVMRVGNAGWSGWFDEYGNIRAMMLDEDRRIYYRGAAAFAIDRDLQWVDRESLYVRWGDWFVGVCGAFAVVGALLLRKAPDAALEFEPLPPVESDEARSDADGDTGPRRD